MNSQDTYAQLCRVNHVSTTVIPAHTEKAATARPHSPIRGTCKKPGLTDTKIDVPHSLQHPESSIQAVTERAATNDISYSACRKKVVTDSHLHRGV